MHKSNLPKHISIAVDADIVLQPIALSHADELFALTDANRDILTQWLPWVPMTKTVDDTIGFIDKSVDDAKNGVSYVYMIMVGGEIAGCFDMRWVDLGSDLDKDMAGIGYWLGANYQGQGVVTKCVNVMTQYAFDNGIKVVYISCATENYASQNVAKRAGYTFNHTKSNAEKLQSGMVDNHVYFKSLK